MSTQPNSKIPFSFILNLSLKRLALSLRRIFVVVCMTVPTVGVVSQLSSSMVGEIIILGNLEMVQFSVP